MNKPRRNALLFVQGVLLVMASSLIIGADSRPGRLLTKVPEKSGSGHRSQKQPVVVSPGLRLEIVELREPYQGSFHVLIRNAFRKDITAVVASAHSEGLNQLFSTDYIYAELEARQRFAPGAINEFSFSPSAVRGVVPQVVVSAIIFGDGTGEGDERWVAEILERRLGMKVQLNRINPYLQRLGRVKPSQAQLELARVKTLAEGLSIDKGEISPTEVRLNRIAKFSSADTLDALSKSTSFESGLRTGRELILRYISKLETVLANERTETFYQSGVQHTLKRTGEEDFRRYLPKIQRDFGELAERL